MVSLVLCRRRRTFFFTILGFILCFVVFVNLMIAQLNNVNYNQEEFYVEGMSQRSLNQRMFDSDLLNSDLTINRKVKSINKKSQDINSDVKSNRELQYKKYKFQDADREDNQVIILTKDQENQNSVEKDYNINHGEKRNTDDYKDEDDAIEDSDENDADDDDNDDEEGNDDGDDLKQGYRIQNENSVFKDGDFGDISDLKFKKPPFRYEEVKSVNNEKNGGKTKVMELDTNSPTVPTKQRDRNIPDKNAQVLNTSKIVIDGIYWSRHVEKLIPEGLSNNDIREYRKSINESYVKLLQKPTWHKCGRPRNAYVILSDGTQACARYKDPHNQYILGEVLSFYLSRLLHLDNVPAVVLSRVTNSSLLWKGTSYKTLEWKEGKIVALIEWINDIIYSSWAHVYMPKLILMALEKNVTIDGKMIAETAKTEKQLDKSLLELAQWGSMIIFDYLTGNYDRVASMQDAAEKEHKPSIIQEHIRNLWKSDTGKLWLIDNESGLLDAYDLLYLPKNSKFLRYHRTMLQTMCVFQKSVVRALKKLHNNTSPHMVLEQYATEHEALLDEVPKKNYYRLFTRFFDKRLQEVIEWINYCAANR